MSNLVVTDLTGQIYRNELKEQGIVMTETKLDLGYCPICGKRMDGHTHVEGKPVLPNDGDLAICFYCHSLLKVVPSESNPSGLGFRVATQDELEYAMDNIPGLTEILQALAILKKRGGSK